jgi:transcriptional regulator with XRE-family HTH domain
MTFTTLSAALAAELRAEMARANVSGAELARRLEVPASWVQRRMSGASPLTVEDLERLAAGLQINLESVILAASGHSESGHRFGRQQARELVR